MKLPRKLSKRMTFVAAVAFVIVCVVGPFDVWYSVSIHSGRRIAAEVERFRMENNELPASLDLLPLGLLERPPFGGHWAFVRYPSWHPLEGGVLYLPYIKITGGYGAIVHRFPSEVDAPEETALGWEFVHGFHREIAPFQPARFLPSSEYP